MFPTATVGVRQFTIASRLWSDARTAAGLGLFFSLFCLLLRPMAAETNEWWAVKPLVRPEVPKLASARPDSLPLVNPLTHSSVRHWNSAACGQPPKQIAAP